MEEPTIDLLVGISTGVDKLCRRRALRNTWFRYKHDDESPLPPELRDRLDLRFIASNREPELVAEAEEEGDLVLLDVAEGYDKLWRKVLGFLGWALANSTFQYFMHADDDSFLRLDLIMGLLEGWPKERFYWGCFWNLTPEGLQTAPIRNPSNKSYMPMEQYPLDHYPPFASGCGFVLSRDLVEALVNANLPDYRVMDPPFGIHLCGREMCILNEAVEPVHEPRVRPYRPLPLFRSNTLVQHYMQPEEMKGFYKSALAGEPPQYVDSEMAGPSEGEAAASPSEELYNTLVDLGIFKR
ncbi:hypothetical protein BSKO_00722 [Bryopsis sp. KO-2023]|nr:hypothetical protein BSKO_00722 [Bryopsis sp. KO-2023]